MPPQKGGPRSVVTSYTCSIQTHKEAGVSIFVPTRHSCPARGFRRTSCCQVFDLQSNTQTCLLATGDCLGAEYTEQWIRACHHDGSKANHWWYELELPPVGVDTPTSPTRPSRPTRSNDVECYVCLSACLSACLPVCLSVCLSLSFRLLHVSNFQCIYLSTIHLSMYLNPSICLSV